MRDIVFPNGNEAEFIKIASKLGYDSLCFVYDNKNFNKIKTNFNVNYGLIVSERDIKKVKKMCDVVFVKSGENARPLIEGNKDIVVFGFEEDNKRDFIHQRRSGLNHIMCKLAFKNNIKLGFNFNYLLNSDIKKRNIIMGRIAANIKLCKKYKVKMVFGSFASNPYEMRNYNDLKTFFLTLGLV